MKFISSWKSFVGEALIMRQNSFVGEALIMRQNYSVS